MISFVFTMQSPQICQTPFVTHIHQPSIVSTFSTKAPNKTIVPTSNIQNLSSKINKNTIIFSCIEAEWKGPTMYSLLKRIKMII